MVFNVLCIIKTIIIKVIQKLVVFLLDIFCILSIIINVYNYGTQNWGPKVPQSPPQELEQGVHRLVD